MSWSAIPCCQGSGWPCGICSGRWRGRNRAFLSDTMRSFVLALAICCLAVPGLRAAELKLLPGDITLTGPHASQRLLAVTATGGVVDSDVSDRAEFASSNPKVATVDAEGIVHAVGDGETTITALA